MILRMALDAVEQHSSGGGSGSNTPWGAIGILITSVTAIVIAIINNKRPDLFRINRHRSDSDAAPEQDTPRPNTRQVAAAVATATAETALETWDRVIGAPLREENARLTESIDRLRQQLDEARDTIHKLQIDCAAKDTQVTQAATRNDQLERELLSFMNRLSDRERDDKAQPPSPTTPRHRADDDD